MKKSEKDAIVIPVMCHFTAIEIATIEIGLEKLKEITKGGDAKVYRAAGSALRKIQAERS